MESLAEDMMRELQQPGVDQATIQGEAPPPHIFMVPENIRAGESRPYEPQILAIGPYHHCDPRLHAMERHKWRYLRHLLRRKSQGDDAIAGALLKDCIKQVEESVARRWYSEPVDWMGSYDFVKMMVLDGCFILELLLKYPDYALAEPLFGIAWMMPVICRDLLKLENQIPFFVIQKLFDVVTLGWPPIFVGISLRELVRGFLQYQLPLTSISSGRRLEEIREVYHLLHFCDLALQVPPQLLVENNTQYSSEITCCTASPSSSLISVMITSILKRLKAATTSSSCTTPPCGVLPITTSSNDIINNNLVLPPDPSEYTIPCAVELREAGIKFRIKPEASSILHVTFRADAGILDVPVLCINDSTDSILRNLIAFENCYPNSDGHVTSYALFLDCIIDTPRDVAILERSGVIENSLGSDEEVAEMVNKLCKQVSLCPGGHYLAKVFREVNGYCESRCHRYRATLVRDYFGSPWSSISLCAATSLLLLTLLQLIYAALTYHS